MHLLLTDILSCPACDPERGLVLLAERMVERRVHEGALGCPVCEKRYPIRAGFAELRGAEVTEDAGALTEAAREEAFRVAALMGVREGPGFSLLLGEAACAAHGVAAVVPRIEVVAVDPRLRGWRESDGVSRLAVAARLPFFSGTMRAAALSGAVSDTWLSEAARVVAKGGRVVLTDGQPDAADRLRAAGLELLVAEGSTAVAQRR